MPPCPGGNQPAAARTQNRGGAGPPAGGNAPATPGPARRPAAQTGLAITICHFPPGTSKWNKVERRLFSHITMNWRGRRLASDEVIVQTIAATTTRTGLRVHAEVDTNTYDTGVRISDRQHDALPMTRHDWHGDWNYTHRPRLTAPGTGRRPVLTLADRLLAVVLHRRLGSPQTVIASLFNVRPETTPQATADHRSGMRRATVNTATTNGIWARPYG